MTETFTLTVHELKTQNSVENMRSKIQIHLHYWASKSERISIAERIPQGTEINVGIVPQPTSTAKVKILRYLQLAQLCITLMHLIS